MTDSANGWFGFRMSCNDHEAQVKHLLYNMAYYNAYLTPRYMFVMIKAVLPTAPCCEVLHEIYIFVRGYRNIAWVREGLKERCDMSLFEPSNIVGFKMGDREIQKFIVTYDPEARDADLERYYGEEVTKFIQRFI